VNLSPPDGLDVVLTYWTPSSRQETKIDTKFRLFTALMITAVIRRVKTAKKSRENVVIQMYRKTSVI
jgi:hypothetical protein